MESELLARIETLERRIDALEARPGWIRGHADRAREWRKNKAQAVVAKCIGLLRRFLTWALWQLPPEDEAPIVVREYETLTAYVPLDRNAVQYGSKRPKTPTPMEPDDHV